MVVDRNTLVRDSLRIELGRIEGVRVVCEASGGALALQTCRNLEIDLAVIGLPGDGVDPIAFVRALKETRVSVKVLCGYEGSDDGEAADLVRAGVDGIVHRDAPADDYVQAVRSILKGHSYLPKVVTDLLVRAEPRTSGGEIEGLTQREIEVLGYIAKGYTNKDIARSMHLSVRTIECHRLNLRRKSGMMRPKDLVDLAHRIGLRTGDPALLWSDGRDSNSADSGRVPLRG